MYLAAGSSSYPLLNIFWTIVEIFLWVIWFWILITIFIDIFRSPDLSGWAKALWFLFVLFIPIIGVLVYLIARGGSMHERSVWEPCRSLEAWACPAGLGGPGLRCRFGAQRQGTWQVRGRRRRGLCRAPGARRAGCPGDGCRRAPVPGCSGVGWRE